MALTLERVEKSVERIHTFYYKEKKKEEARIYLLTLYEDFVTYLVSSQWDTELSEIKEMAKEIRKLKNITLL